MTEKAKNPVGGMEAMNTVVSEGTNQYTVEPAAEEANEASKDAVAEHEYPGALSLTAIMVALYLAIFLVALVSLFLFI